MRAAEMGTVAFLFPGQGSQYVGMAKDLYAADLEARETIDSADTLLGFPLSRICFEGPEHELRQTSNTQPAIFLHSVIVARKLLHLEPAMVAGHSLGEYSALVVAEALELDEALHLVRLRGELMQRAGEERPGTMAAVVGLSREAIDGVCTEAAADGVVQPANYNSPGQIVISGSVSGVRRAMELARTAGAKMVKELVVSGAFHSPLMEGAGEELKQALESADIRDARIPVYANVTAEPVTRAAEIRTLLHRQLTSPVRWEESVRAMVRDGAATMYETGPGKVLQGLVKRTAPNVKTGGFDTIKDLLAA